MKLFFSYLKRHYKIVLMLLLFCGIFGAVFALYRLPVESVLYAGLLCLVLGLILLGFGFASYRRRCRVLRVLEKQDLVSLQALPEPKGELEESYQALIRQLWADRAAALDKAALEQKNREEYFALWVHQIKTPIAAMELLLQEPAEDVPTLRGELFRIEEYVGMALSYMRLDSPSTDYVFKKYDLDGILRGALRKYARLFILKKLSLRFTPTNQSVVTDEKWLSFVVEQLLSNALKYTRQGTIFVGMADKELLIGDTGIGIEASDLPRVFEKGFTGCNGRENKKTTGLGLYLCREVCLRLGHGIRMESEKGKGTRVYLDLTRSAPPVE